MTTKLGQGLSRVSGEPTRLPRLNFFQFIWLFSSSFLYSVQVSYIVVHRRASILQWKQEGTYASTVNFLCVTWEMSGRLELLFQMLSSWNPRGDVLKD